MASRRSGYAASIDPSPSNAGSRKQSIINIPDRMEPCYERKADTKGGYGASQGGGVTVTSSKSRSAPTIQIAMSAAVDTSSGEVVVVSNETQQESSHKEQENQRLKVRSEVSERESKTLQECSCSAQKLIDQSQVSYTGPQQMGQSVFGPQLSSVASSTQGLDRDHQNSRSVNGAGVDLGLGGSVDESLHGFEPRDEYKMCQLSIQPDGSVTNHTSDSFSSSSSHMCSDPRGADDRQPQGPSGTSRFEIKEEKVPPSAAGQPDRKDSQVGDGDGGSSNVGDITYGQVGGEGGTQRSFSNPLRHQRLMRECGAALQQQQGGLDGRKPLARTFGADGGDTVSPGRAEDSAGPSASDNAGEPSADRPHHCLECGKTFRSISSSKKHIRIHTGEKPYPCAVCGRRFRESGASKTHSRIHTGEKPYSCSECGNCFRHSDGSRKHRRTHTGEKPYVCAICGKRSSRSQHLKHHQLIHTGERPCCCPFCNRTFKEPAASRKHVRTHRDEGGHMGIAPIEETDADAMDDINNLHPAAPSPQMQFGEWGGEEEDGSAADCVQGRV